MAQRYLTALKGGQATLAKESGDYYSVHGLDLSTSGLSTGTPGALTMSNINGDFSAAPDGTGLVLPQSNGAPSVVGGEVEGAAVWDYTNGVLYAFHGAAYQQLTSAAVLPTSSQAGSILIGNGSGGWADEADVTVSSAGLITVGATGGLDFNGINVDIDNSGSFDVQSAGVVSIDGVGASNLSATSGNLVVSTITSGTLELTSAGLVDLNAAANLDVDVTGTMDFLSTGTFSIDGTGASNVSATSGNLTLSTITGGDVLVSSAAEVDLTSVGLMDFNAGANLDIDVTGTFDMLSTGAFSIDGTGASNVSATSGNLTISTITGGSLIATSAADVDINATTGVTIDGAGISIDGTAASNFTVTGAADLTLSSTLGSTILTSGESAADAVRLNATGANGGVDIDALLGGVTIDTTGAFSIDGDTASNVSVTTGNLTISTISSGDLLVNSAAELDLTAAGLVDINAGANLDIDVTGSTAITSSTTTTIETVGGDTLLDNQFATGSTIIMMGTDTSATDFLVQNDSATTLFSIDGAGQAEFNYGVGIDGSFRLGAAGASKVTMDAATGDTLVAGNLTVTGTMFIADTQQVLIEDNNLYLNCTDVTPGAGTGGITVNYNPTATTDTVASGGFTAGVAATSNPTVATTGAATFSVGDFIQITDSNNAANKGLFEVLSHAANVLTIRGVGVTGCQEDFTQNQFVTDTVVAGTITKVNVSIIRAGTDGAWEVSLGSSSPTGTPLTFVDLVTSTSGLTLQAAYVGGNTITTSGGEGDLTFAGTEDLNITLDNINMNPTGDVVLNMDSDKNFVMTVGASTATETPSNFSVTDGTLYLMAGNFYDEAEYFAILGDADVITLESVNELTLTAGTTLLLEASSQVEIKVPDDSGSVFEIIDSANSYLTIHSNTGAETIQLGDAGLATQEVHVAAPGGLRFGLGMNNKGTTYLDEYGMHVVCYVPATKSTTVAQGVAFLTSGTFEVSGLAADVDQVTVPEMVRGVAQATAAATDYVKVQISGIAEVEVDQTGSPAVDEGTLLKWALNGKTCLDTRDLSAAAPYYEELAGVVVAAANRAGAAYNPGSQNRVQIMLMNPVAGTYIPA